MNKIPITNKLLAKLPSAALPGAALPGAALLLAALFLAACSAASPVEFVQSGAPVMEEMEPGFAPEAAYDEDRAAGANVFTSSSVPQAAERIVIKDANLTIAVEEPADSVKEITLMAEEMGGFVVSSNTYLTTLSSGAEVPRASITVRIPADRLNEALDLIRAQSDQPVTNENINSQDVTEDYTDLQSRLRNLENTETKLQDIMDEAFQTEDVLAVYQQLVQVREQIEVTKGRIRFYEQSAALSSVSVEILANAAVQPLTVGGWQPVGVARQALQALISAVQFLVTALIWIVLFALPVLLLVGLLPALIIWGIMRWRARRKAKKAA